MSTLYIVSTPIGNLEDITLRAIRILKEVDFVLCEDTRVTKNLLAHYQIATPTLSFHQHSTGLEIDKLINLIKEGKNLALVTDAGTPGVSDPGGVLVAEAVKQFRPEADQPLADGSEVKIETIPGPSALTAAIAISGLPMEKFLFLGFLPHKKGRQTLLKKIAESEYPVVLYESVHRIGKLLNELSGPAFAQASADKQDYQLVVGRELTKKFETVYRGSVEEVKSQLKPTEVKGEFVVIIHKHE
ncbi:MAG: 16S rRNA (cytidine(1402)-2'-O)-methyltransferase [Candidatus Komeilibacteria bacterium]|nr:16S rRNA (cytidine(1402)-2'-O)-methyltransferase [Candidatus Komeilibacteria bacterium]